MAAFLRAIFWLSLGFFVAAILTLGASFARASYIITQQTDASTATAATSYSTNGLQAYEIPFSTAGVLNEIDLQASADTSGKSLDAQILCYSNFALTVACPADWGDGSGNLFSDQGAQAIATGGAHTYTWTFTGGYDTTHRTIHADRYYLIEFQYADSHVSIWGSASPAPYYVMSGLSTDTTTRIVQINSPANGAVLSGNAVNFSFDYYYNSASTTYDHVGATLTDVSAGQNLIGPPEETIIADGGSTYSETLALTTGHSYSWTPFMSSASTTFPTIYGPTYSFSIGTSGVGTTTVPSFLSGLWDAIQSNPPFGFIFQLRTDLQDLGASSTPAVSLNLATFEIDNVFHPLDLAIAGVLYLVFTVWAFKRFQHFEF